MKKRIKKLFYSAIMAFISIGVNFNAEARLPKYMAQRAAELLIEKSEINFDKEYGVRILLNRLKKSKAPNLDNFTTSLFRLLKLDLQNTSLANILKNKLISFNEDQQADSNTYAKEILKVVLAHKLVNFLYSTEKRQHLANWMKNRIEQGQIKSTTVNDSAGTVQHFTSLFTDIREAYVDDYNFRRFVNQHFPCWTGTLTCFILNGEAHQLLARGNAVDSCRTKLSSAKGTRKIVSILFVLELIDNWNDIKQICKTEEDDGADRLKEPDYVALDPYDCVPVPNTAYEYEGIFKGTCLLSTIRNLLSILGGPDQDFIRFNINHEVKGYLRGHNLANIPGITNINEQNKWAGTLLAIRDLHLPDLKGFVDTLIGLLDTKNENILQLYEQAKLQQYRDGFNSRTKTQRSSIEQDILDPLITQILKSITNHDIRANSRTANQTEKTTRTWPVLILEISDNSIHKKITVGIGHVGGGQHIEILNIELV